MATASTNYSSVSDSTAITITLAGLATSSGLTAGRESTVVDNTTNKYLDALVSGQITTGTTPTVNTTIAVYVYTPLKVAGSTFTYPIATATALTAVDAAATFENGQLGGAVRFACAATVNATSDRAYNFSFSVAQLFGGVMPLKWGLWVAHSTVVNLNATAGNHYFHYVGIKADIA